ncbi:MAG: hypothetical protein IKV35_03970 [Clostridia bacterium]|nr:hypothetical protein [Clostridia bacterium]
MVTRISALALSLLLLCSSFMLTGCRKETYNLTFKDRDEVINYALHYVVNVQDGGEVTKQYYTARVISQELGFTSFNNPKYSSIDLTQNDDGSFTVKAKGSISGQFADGTVGTKGFEIAALVTSQTEPPQVTVTETK